MSRVLFILDNVVVKAINSRDIYGLSKANIRTNWQYRILTEDSAPQVGWSYVDGEFSSGE